MTEDGRTWALLEDDGRREWHAIQATREADRDRHHLTEFDTVCGRVLYGHDVLTEPHRPSTSAICASCATRI